MMRFNPPPGWPASPEGWKPEPGWQPDPSWPPAPKGWQFWTAEDSRQIPRRRLVTIGAIAAVVVAAAAVVAAVTLTGKDSSASDNQSPPVVALDGKDLNLGNGVTKPSSVCQDNPQPGVRKSVTWRGLTTTGSEPEKVALLFLTRNDAINLSITLSNGQTYNSNLKTTHITADGPTNGIYTFSGTVHRDSSSDADFLTTLNVSGSMACANYGSSSGCKFASVAEMSAAAI